MKVLIIGGVAAGPKTASRLKRIMPGAEITIIDRDNLISYGGCGIPYYVSGDISDEKELRNTSFHMTRDEKFFARAKGVEVLTRLEATAIDRKAKTVRVKNLDSGGERDLDYDKLVLTTGARAHVLPVAGADLPGVYTVSDLHKAIAIKEDLARGRVARAVVIGGGAIGIEMAEAFADLWGAETSLIEFMDQLLPNLLDRPMALMLKNAMERNGVNIHTGEGVKEIIADNDGRAAKVVTDQHSIDCDIVIMAAGVRPRDGLARDAGLLTSPRGGIVINERMQTSDPDIYAAGDCLELSHLVTGRKGYAPMGSLANRQGRVVADNIAGLARRFPGYVGSFIMKAFDVCVGATGLTFRAAKTDGLNADFVITAQSDRAHFFPEQTVIPLQMVFDRDSRRVVGLQGFGPMGDGILARIDAACGLIARGATIDEFSNLEMAYAPPFATALDALNATANAADNKAADRLRYVSVEDFMAWMDDMDSRPDWIALDIRHPVEAEPFVKKFGDHWLAIPYIEMRERWAELPTDKELLIICDAGTRSYEIQCLLDSRPEPFRSLVLGGGFNCIRRIGVPWWPQS